jgi:hypothetical protein
MSPDMSQFAEAVRDALNASSSAPSKDWEVKPETWAKLDTGFDYNGYTTDEVRNKGLKYHLAEVWAVADNAKRRELGEWIIRDWGRIKGNKADTIDRHVALANEIDPVTPFAGIASYSKILSIKDPNRFAVFDARVAYALNAIQLCQTAGLQDLGRFLVFPCPPGQNREISGEGKKPGYMDLLGRSVLVRRGFTFVEKSDSYQTYLRLLRLASEKLRNRTILDIEMELFGKVIHFCERARLRLAASSA